MTTPFLENIHEQKTLFENMVSCVQTRKSPSWETVPCGFRWLTVLSGMVKLCCLYLLCFLICGQAVSGAEFDLSVDIPDVSVRVGLFNLNGYHNFVRGEPVGGYGYDYLQKIRLYAPFAYEYYGQDQDWSNAFQMLKEGKIDVLTNVRKTPEREKEFAFTKYSMGHSSTILTVKCGDTRFHSGEYSHWNGIRIGILKNDSGQAKLSDYIRQKGTTCKIVTYDDEKTMYADLQAARNIDAVLSNSLRHLTNEWILDRLGVEPFYIAVRKDRPDLLEYFNKAMERLEMNEPAYCDALWQQYYAWEPVGTVTYSRGEFAFINKMRKDGQKFKAILNPDRYPISWYADGKQQGILKNIADEIIRRTGLDIEFLPIRTPEDFKKATTDSQVDIVFDFYSSLRKGEKDKLVLSRPYITFSTFMLQNKKAGDSLKKLKRVAFIESYCVLDQVKELLSPKVEIVYCRTAAEAVERVTSGDCEATCLHAYMAEYAVRNDPYGRLMTTVIPNAQVSLSVGVRETRNPFLASVLNKATVSIDSDFIAQSRERYDLSFDDSFSITAFAIQHPFLVSGVPIVILMLICVFLWYVVATRKNLYRLGVVFDNMPCRYFFANAEGKLLQYGYGDEKTKPVLRSIDDVRDESVRQLIKDFIKRAFETGKRQNGIYQDAGRSRIGSIMPVDPSLFGFPAVIGISNDITELQNSRKEIEKQEKYFWRTLNSIGDAVVTTDQAGNIIMLNPVAERMMGVKLSEVAGKPLCDYFMTTIGRNGDIVESPVSRTIQTRTNIPASEGAILKSYDGKNTYPITGVSSPILDEQENVLGAILVFRDITEETKRQEEIKGELANWEAATRLASIYPFRYNLVTNTNESGDKILEVWPHCDGKPCLPQDWIIPEDYPEWKQRYDEVACNKVAHVVVRYRAMQRGKMRHFLGFIQKPSASGEYLTGLIQDITSIVETQDKERVLQTMWTACVESMPVIMFIKAPNDDFRYRQCNANFAKFLGLKKEEIIGHNDEELLRHGVPEQCLSNDLQVIKEGKPFEFLETVYSCDGVEHHFRTVKVSTIGPDGEPVLIALSLDETEDYKRQQKMKEVLEDWENAAEVAHIASYRIDKSMNLLSHMDRVTDFWSFDENGNPVSAEEHLCPEDVVSYNEMYRCVFSGEQETATMLCHVPQPEGMRYLRLFIRRTTDQNDVVVSGLVQDVTEHIIEQKKREALLALWKKVIDTLPAIFFVKNADDDFRCLQINDKCCSMVGLKPEEIIGRTEFEFLPNPEEAWKNLEEDQEVMKSGKLFYCTETLQSASGVRTTCKTVKIPAVDEDGRRILIAMSQDITDEQELFESQKIISSALEKLFSSDDLEGDICSLLEDICNYLGFGYGFICRLDEETDMLRFFTSYHRKGLSPLLDTKKFCIGNASTHPWYREMENGNLDELLCFDFSDEQDIERARNYVPLIVALAKEKDIRGTYLKYVSLNGKPWGYVGFMTCGYALNTLSEQHKNLLCLTAHIVEMAITRKRTQDRLQFALEAAQTADKAKRFFLSSMSHEIRTPLNAMVGFTDLLKDPDLDHETRIDFLNSITESSNALLALLNNVLTLSKLVSGNYSLHPVWTVFEEVFYELDRDFRPAAKKKNLDLVFNFDSVPQLYLDRPCLNRILSCLVGNAIEFTQKGTVTVTVNYYPTTVEEGDLLLKVSDTGIGIIASDREKIFEPFVPLTSRMRGTFSSRRGTGLALPIVKKIVEIHGGRLELDSEIAKGTTFTILLPNIARHREEESANALLNEIRPAATAQEMKSIELHPAVLVVDDAQMVLDILAQMLSKYHISVSMAHSGKEALECLEHQSFDIILTDMLMPEMSGTELAQKIRSMSQYKSMKIYAMSTENESIMYDKKLFDKVLLKPIKRKALNEIIFGNGTDEQQNEQQDAKK